MSDLVENPEDRFSHDAAHNELHGLRCFQSGKTQTSLCIHRDYRKVSKFSDARKLCRNLLKILTKRPNLRVFRQKDANGIAKSEDPDQTAPLFAQTCLSENFGSLW